MEQTKDGKLSVIYIKAQCGALIYKPAVAALQWQPRGSEFCSTLAYIEGPEAWARYQAWRRAL